MAAEIHNFQLRKEMKMAAALKAVAKTVDNSSVTAVGGVVDRLGQGVVEGDLFRATIVVAAPGGKVDWESVARDVAARFKLGEKAFDNCVDKHTTVGEQREATVSVKARKG
jgi:hypothetical protein